MIKIYPKPQTDAMICSFECTYGTTCALKVFQNVCPSCAVNFEKRTIRPKNMALKHLVSHKRVFVPKDLEKVQGLMTKLKDTPPKKKISMQFETYKPRKIEFLQLSEVDNWKIKIYSITNKEKFTSFNILQKVVAKLPIWLNKAEESHIASHKIAFLIVHEAREGVWVLLNWWTGGEMIETKIYFIDYETPNIIRKSPYGTNSLLCVWELEVFLHERKTWIKEVLLNADNPMFNNYLENVIKN